MTFAEKGHYVTCFSSTFTLQNHSNLYHIQFHSLQHFSRPTFVFSYFYEKIMQNVGETWFYNMKGLKG